MTAPRVKRKGMSGGRGFSERHSAKKGPPPPPTLKLVILPLPSLPPSSLSTLPSGRSRGLPPRLSPSLARIPAFLVKQERGNAARARFPPPRPAERQLDHLRHHYLSLFLCNFPSRTPTCQMTKPKSHFLAAHVRAPSRPERGRLSGRTTGREEGGPPSASLRRRCGIDHHRKEVLIPSFHLEVFD